MQLVNNSKITDVKFLQHVRPDPILCDLLLKDTTRCDQRIVRD
jgi:hypothetical protein